MLLSDVSHPAPSLPPGLNNMFGFQVFNSLSFQIILSSPMLLYAKSLGASATVLGLITGMMPLLVIAQIPAAKHVARVGYRRFIFMGWGTRVGFIFVLALVPLGGEYLSNPARIGLVLFLLFGFNLARGISSAAWLPWVTTLVPDAVRGRYLTREAAFANLGSFGAFLLAASYLGQQSSGEIETHRFAALFAFSAVMGAISLTFLRHIPSPPAPEDEMRNSREPVPWREIARYAPFRKLLFVNAIFALAMGGVGTFVVDFLKSSGGLSEGRILLVSAMSFIGGLSSLWVLGSRLDRFGSRPVMQAAMAGWFLILTGWVLIAGRVVPAWMELLCTLHFLMGLCGSLFGMAATRLAMATVPVMGRSHFFALYSVISSLTLGLSPVLWGALIDLIRPLGVMGWLGAQWNAFSLAFAAMAVVGLVPLPFCRHLVEPQAAKVEDLLRDLFQQPLVRLWLRR